MEIKHEELIHFLWFLEDVMINVSSVWRCVPGHAVSGGRGVLALHRVGSPSLWALGGAGHGPVLAQLVQAGLPGDVQPHGLLVVNMDALSGRHVALESQNGFNLEIITKIYIFYLYFCISLTL